MRLELYSIEFQTNNFTKTNRELHDDEVLMQPTNDLI